MRNCKTYSVMKASYLSTYLQHIVGLDCLFSDIFNEEGKQGDFRWLHGWVIASRQSCIYTGMQKFFSITFLARFNSRRQWELINGIEMFNLTLLSLFFVAILHVCYCSSTWDTSQTKQINKNFINAAFTFLARFISWYKPQVPHFRPLLQNSSAISW